MKDRIFTLRLPEALRDTLERETTNKIRVSLAGTIKLIISDYFKKHKIKIRKSTEEEKQEFNMMKEGSHEV